MSNTTVANIFLIAPELVAVHPVQVSAIVVTAADKKTTVSIDGTEYSVNASAETMTIANIAIALASALNTALSDILTAVATSGGVTLTAVTAGTGFTPLAVANCSVSTSVPNSDLLALILSDVATQCNTNLGAKQEQAQRFLAAHLLTMMNEQIGATGPLASESAGGVSLSYATAANPDSYESTHYGIRYKQILKSCIDCRVRVY